MDYYNEIDPYAAQWLRNLIDAGHIAPGWVDTRSIEDVKPNELTEFRRCHFFAGIGGWALALEIAGWPSDRRVWTESCPCQPFSAAGKGDGFADERHLWPAWQHLIAQCSPPEIFGEQVASKATEPWVDLVQADLEGMGYAFGCVPYPAAGIGAPHIRDRLYWVAHAYVSRSTSGIPAAARGHEGFAGISDHGCGEYAGVAGRSSACGLADLESIGRREECPHDGRCAAGNRTEGFTPGPVNGRVDRGPGPVNGEWAAADWLLCRDGKWRPVEPGTFPLAHGVSGRVGRLRAYGNAIVPAQAAEFIGAYLDTY
jgi:DNA (cytosine-5)-methyltransferase 1